MNIIDQLYLVYLNEAWWDEPKVSKHEIDGYHRIMISRGNLFYELDGEKLVGYAEILKINFEQLGRTICRAPFDHLSEDTLQGNIALVQIVWIDKDYRNTEVIKKLTDRFYKFTDKCDYFSGIALRKKTQPYKIFDRRTLEKFIMNKNGVLNG